MITAEGIKKLFGINAPRIEVVGNLALRCKIYKRGIKLISEIVGEDGTVVIKKEDKWYLMVGDELCLPRCYKNGVEGVCGFLVTDATKKAIALIANFNDEQFDVLRLRDRETRIIDKVTVKAIVNITSMDKEETS